MWVFWYEGGLEFGLFGVCVFWCVPCLICGLCVFVGYVACGVLGAWVVCFVCVGWCLGCLLCGLLGVCVVWCESFLFVLWFV